MKSVFGAGYADAYDMLYKEKDYPGECDLLETLFRRYGTVSICRVIDLGCGTGTHAVILAQRGYEVVGIDASESMLAHVERKTKNTSERSKLSFHVGDICTLNLQERFDAAIMMFAVLGYQEENDRVLSALRTARRHLQFGGLLIFDVWYGPAVLFQRPSQRISIIPTPEGQILRFASGELDVLHHLCKVNYHVWRLEGERLVAETEERHVMRYFFPRELELFLESSGFSLIRLGAFPEFDHDPDERTWNISVVAKAI